MNISTFDPDAFLNTQHQGANDTQFIPHPIGEYAGVIEKVTPRQWTSKKDPSKSGVALDVAWSIDDPVVLQTLGRDKSLVNQGIMLDLTPAGAIDFGPGRNVNLGRLREAVGLNDPSQPFTFSMLIGRVAKVKVEHEMYNNAPYAKVTAVARM